MLCGICAVVLLHLSVVTGQGYLAQPKARGTRPNQFLHSEYGDNGTYPLLRDGILETCGNQAMAIPNQFYYLGDKLNFSWVVTENHTGTPENVRLAIKYDMDANFSENVLFYGENGDISGSTNPGKGGTVVHLATEAFKYECERCVLQWSWDSAEAEAGYISCADITIIKKYDGPVNNKCYQFCQQLQNTCNSNMTQYASLPHCLKDCQRHPRSILEGAVRGDTFECRKNYLEMAKNSTQEAILYCNNTGYDGGDFCSESESQCSNFCATYRNVCPNDYIYDPDYQTHEKCVARCETYKQTSLIGATFANTYQCREYFVQSSWNQSQVLEANNQLDAEEEDKIRLLHELGCARSRRYPSGACTDGYSRCDAYCASFKRHCNKTLEVEDCLEQCKAFPVGDVDLGVLSGNTIQCREYHLGIIAETRGCMIEENTLWQGAELESLQDSNTTTNCSSFCLESEDCEFWVFRTDTKVCSLMKNRRRVTIGNNVVSGNKCIDHCVHAAYDGGEVCTSPRDKSSSSKTMSAAWVTCLVLFMSALC